MQNMRAVHAHLVQVRARPLGDNAQCGRTDSSHPAQNFPHNARYDDGCYLLEIHGRTEERIENATSAALIPPPKGTKSLEQADKETNHSPKKTFIARNS